MASSSTVARAALEFLPDAAELEQRPAPWTARLTLYLLTLALASGITWAALAHIDRVVTARGKLVTTAATMVVQPLETSIVRTIDAKVGDLVRRGDVLATLDQTFSEADVGQLSEKVVSLAAEIGRLDAEIADQPFRVDLAGANAEERLQGIIHQRRRAQYVARGESFDRQIGRALAGIETKRADRVALDRRLVVARELEQMRGALFDKDVGSKINLLDARNNRLQIERD